MQCIYLHCNLLSPNNIICESQSFIDIVTIKFLEIEILNLNFIAINTEKYTYINFSNFSLKKTSWIC